VLQWVRANDATARLGTRTTCVATPVGPGSRRCWRGWTSSVLREEGPYASRQYVQGTVSVPHEATKQHSTIYTSTFLPTPTQSQRCIHANVF